MQVTIDVEFRTDSKQWFLMYDNDRFDLNHKKISDFDCKMDGRDDRIHLIGAIYDASFGEYVDLVALGLVDYDKTKGFSFNKRVAAQLHELREAGQYVNSKFWNQEYGYQRDMERKKEAHIAGFLSD